MAGCERLMCLGENGADVQPLVVTVLGLPEQELQNKLAREAIGGWDVMDDPGTWDHLPRREAAE